MPGLKPSLIVVFLTHLTPSTTEKNVARDPHLFEVRNCTPKLDELEDYLIHANGFALAFAESALGYSNVTRRIVGRARRE
jgi:hypothetical protein